MYEPDEVVQWGDEGPNPYLHTCLRCGKVWIRRIMHKPKTCANPKCRSPYWDVPPKNKKLKQEPANDQP